MILVVDDDHAIAQVLNDLLVREGYEVRMASNGQEAYEILKLSKCKGMLLDMLMPGINGAALLMLIASEGIKLPIIVIAGSPDFSEEEIRDFPNVVGFIRKPFYPEEALTMIRKHIAKPDRAAAR